VDDDRVEVGHVRRDAVVGVEVERAGAAAEVGVEADARFGVVIGVVKANAEGVRLREGETDARDLDGRAVILGRDRSLGEQRIVAAVEV
jgi:hypothetical protein